MQNYQNYKVDLSNCDNEPIHIIGRIQPHGFLFILNKVDLTVEQCSVNVSSFLDADTDALLGKSLSTIIGQDEYKTLEKQIRTVPPDEVELLQLQGKSFFGFIHESEGSLVVECEPFERNYSDKEVLQTVGSYSVFQRELDVATDNEMQSKLVVDYVQELLDYDRVMLYRFDESWNGEVIAENIKPGVHSYMYHHFPSTDIPAQARALLVQKRVRQIVNVNAKAVNISPYLNPTTGKPSNIIQSEIRNPSEIHLEYLRNMDVQATLSISIIVRGKLWGIIACQHSEPRLINFWRRQMCLNVAQAYANRLLASRKLRDQQQLEGYRRVQEQLMQQVEESRSISTGLIESDRNLLDITEAEGAALLLNKKLYTIGRTPEPEQIRELANWLAFSNLGQVYKTRNLSQDFPEAEVYRKEASGLMALELSKQANDYILYFKPEIQETRIWAGDPDKPLDAGKTYLHPRKSFEQWTETVKGRSLVWSQNEQDIAQTLVKDVVAFIVQDQASRLKSLNKELNRTTNQLKSKNKRLEDFAHIISHNLRSPLSNMQGLYNLFMHSPEEMGETKLLNMMQQMIGNMAETIDDLNIILESESEMGLDVQEVNIADEIKKQLQSHQATILQSGATITTDLQASTVYLPKIYLDSILHNLISNALKYRSPDRKPQLTIKTWQEQKLFCLSVTDNGLGMDMAKVSRKLFSIYATFHKNNESKGLGLYLTKMQAEALGGTIQVESQPGVGSTFTVCLPNKKK